jgi:ATP-binding cassette subfamily B protein
MTSTFADTTWPASRLGEAIAALGRHNGLGNRRDEAGSPPPNIVADGGEQLGSWIEATSRHLGLEAEPVEASYREMGYLLSQAGPALLCLPGRPEAQFLVLLGGDRRRLSVLSPDLNRVRLSRQVVQEALCREVEVPSAKMTEQLLDDIQVRGRRRNRARQALTDELLASQRIGGCWLLRPAGNTNFGTHAREAGLFQLLIAVIGAHFCEYGLWILSWWLLGWMTLTGRLDFGWLLAWLLLLLTLIPFRLLTTGAGGLFAIRAGALLKRRLLFGALQLDAEEIRHEGAGQLLGRVLESEAIESLALNGGFLGLTAVVELVLASIVLGAGAGSWIHVTLLLIWAATTLFLGGRYYRRRRQWTKERLGITNDLVERMIGHRTRLAQELRQQWHAGEDQGLEHYAVVSRALDRLAASLQAFVPRCWLIVGLLGLVPAFIAADRSNAVMAIGVGGVILAYRAFKSLADGLEQLAAAAIAWERVRPFWQAASRREPVGHPGLATASATEKSRESGVLLDVRDLVFRYPDRGEPVLDGVGVRLGTGDRLLLEGPSGGGKSTLAAVLAGCRVPQAGLLLLDGLDRETLGADEWRRRIVIAPQFHENHVLMGTFAFNALMGRAWPPRQADLEQAEKICRALDLGPLLDRMPGGLQQIVGETGWQLSHGEKSRLYIARALLQRADMIILDESFAALDPETLRRALAVVLETAAAVLVIAHP